MLRDVRHEVTDGLLGMGSDFGEGVHLKIGASPVENSTPITISGSMSVLKIREKLGHCPLADAVMDSVENGSNKIFCLPVKAGISGCIGSISSTVTSTGNIDITGSPTNAFDIIIKITAGGGLNTAVFTYSVNGGVTYSDEETVPVSGTYEIPDTGLEIAFTASDDTAFSVDDAFICKTTAPRMTNMDVLTAIDKLRNLTLDYEMVHIVGESGKELWAAISGKQKELYETYHKPLLFVMEAYNINQNEAVMDYADRLEFDRKVIKNYAVQIVAARSIYTGMDGITRERNNAGIVMGWYAKAKVNQSIGEVITFAMDNLKMQKLLPEGIADSIDIIDAAGYLTFRSYDGLEGFYVTNARVMCADNSDYRYAEDVRVLHKIIKKTRKEALQLMQQDVDLDDLDGDLASKAEFIAAPIEDMIIKKEISSVKIEVPEEQDIITTGTMFVRIRYTPRGKIREIVIDLGVKP